MTKRLVHRFWIGPPHPEHIWITNIVQYTHPECDVIEWSLDNLPSSIRSKMDPSDHPGHLSNIVRHWSLYELGGLWLDHDVIPLTDLTLSPNPWTAAIRDLREGSSMWFPTAGHPMMAEMLDIGLKSSVGLRPPERSGTKWLRRIGVKYPDVGIENRVIPFDSLGRRCGTNELLAIHLWSTTILKPNWDDHR